VSVDVKHFNVALPNRFAAKHFLHWHGFTMNRSALVQLLKLIPTFIVGKRDAYHAKAFMGDLAKRLAKRIQISTDALKAYPSAIESAFGCEIDAGVIVKTYSVVITVASGGIGMVALCANKTPNFIALNMRAFQTNHFLVEDFRATRADANTKPHDGITMHAGHALNAANGIAFGQH